MVVRVVAVVAVMVGVARADDDDLARRSDFVTLDRFDATTRVGTELSALSALRCTGSCRTFRLEAHAQLVEVDPGFGFYLTATRFTEGPAVPTLGEAGVFYIVGGGEHPPKGMLFVVHGGFTTVFDGPHEHTLTPGISLLQPLGRLVVRTDFDARFGTSWDESRGAMGAVYALGSIAPSVTLSYSSLTSLLGTVGVRWIGRGLQPYAAVEIPLAPNAAGPPFSFLGVLAGLEYRE